MSINMQNYWYSPGYVIAMAQELISKYGQAVIDRDTIFQRVGEMKGAAILSLANHKVLGHHIFMQSSEEDFPDVYALYQEEIPGENVDTKYQTIEVVEYRPNINKPVSDFILDSKLCNPKKAYDEETIILCYIRKGGTHIDFNELYEKLKRNTFRPKNVYILGNKVGAENIFVVSQIWPVVAHAAVDFIEESKRYPLPHRMRFNKGVPKRINYGQNPAKLMIDPYAVFNLNKTKIEAKYGNVTDIE